MGQELWAVAGIIGAVVANILLCAVGFANPLAIAAGAVAGAAVAAAWVYSPLPTRTLFGVASEGGDYWGFSPPDE